MYLNLAVLNIEYIEKGFKNRLFDGKNLFEIWEEVYKE